MASPVSAQTARYEIVPTISRFTIRAFASGLLSAFGHSPTFAVRDFEGEVFFSSDDIGRSRVRITVRANSLGVTDNMKDKDRREIEQVMNDDVLQSARYPEIVLESSSVSGSLWAENQWSVEIAANLSLHGETNAITIPARLLTMGETLHANGEFTILQTAFGIKPVRAAGGALKVKDELKATFNIVARKQDQ